MVLLILRAVLWVGCQQMKAHLAAFPGVLRKLTHSYVGGNVEHSTAAVPPPGLLSFLTLWYTLVTKSMAKTTLGQRANH